MSLWLGSGHRLVRGTAISGHEMATIVCIGVFVSSHLILAQRDGQQVSWELMDSRRLLALWYRASAGYAVPEAASAAPAPRVLWGVPHKTGTRGYVINVT
ncbi:hypothetical protein EVAR_34374_1 [Eumeta japonica]|uniref:Uncharacterized protein n=1 Tax=Eumeta variegata TaxID=151549 RepID=A0A4C1YMZ9_EUMVA|nr:hypothetical protein EVAR_34374_1 [Eumeta japonica]